MRWEDKVPGRGEAQGQVLVRRHKARGVNTCSWSRRAQGVGQPTPRKVAILWLPRLSRATSRRHSLGKVPRGACGGGGGDSGARGARGAAASAATRATRGRLGAEGANQTKRSWNN